MSQYRNRLNVTLFVILMALAFSVTFVSGYATRAMADSRAGLSGGYPLFAEARQIIENNFLGTLPEDKVQEYGIIRGWLNTVGDRYTIFLEPPAQELESQSLQGEFGGIGVSIRRDDNGAVVLSPFDDMPAARAGVLEGDILIAVDNNPVTPETTTDQISAWVRGPVDTDVKITVQRGGQTLEFKMRRQVIEIPSVTGRVLEQDPRIGLVALSRFSEKTPDEVQQTVDSLQAKGVTRIILDLRGNGGGLLDSAVKTASLFLDGGVVMYENRRDQAEKVYSAPGEGAEAALPLVIIVNGGTASAAEILAGALRDRGRGPLIGQTTFGKGSVQLIFTLSDGSSIHVTNARWYTPNHTGIDGVGLRPDIEMEPGTDGRDPELDRAVEYLKNLP
jgi:carboxyl-terminal processing protease